MKRLLSSRWASATKMVCQLELMVETQPQLHPALLRLAAITSQSFTNLTISVVVQHRLRRCFAQFKLCVDPLQPRSERPRRTVNAEAVVSSTTSSLPQALISRLNNHRALRRRLRRRGGWRQQQYTSGGAAFDLGENTVVDAGGGIGV